MRVGFCVRRVLVALVLAELLLHVGGGLVDRRDDGAGGRIGFLAGVQADGAEASAVRELHDLIHDTCFNSAKSTMSRSSKRALPPAAGFARRVRVDRRAGRTAMRAAPYAARPRDRHRPGDQVRRVPDPARGGTRANVPTFVAVIDTVARRRSRRSALTYFAARLIVLAKRRLLWRVRRKLILSYVFIGFVPALLLVAFSLLCGFLLFYNFSSYLVQSRLRALADQARFFAQSTALEIQRAGGRDVGQHHRAPAGQRRQPVPRHVDRRRAGRSRCADRHSATPHAESAPAGQPRPASRNRTLDPPARWAHLGPPRDAARVDRLRRVLRRARAIPTAAPRPATMRTRTSWCAASRSPIRPDPATRWSSICSSTRPSGSSCSKDTGVELKTVTAAPPRDADARAAAGRTRRRRRYAMAAADAAGHPERAAEPDGVSRLVDGRAPAR